MVISIHPLLCSPLTMIIVFHDAHCISFLSFPTLPWPLHLHCWLWHFSVVSIASLLSHWSRFQRYFKTCICGYDAFWNLKTHSWIRRFLAPFAHTLCTSHARPCFSWVQVPTAGNDAQDWLWQHSKKPTITADDDDDGICVFQPAAADDAGHYKTSIDADNSDHRWLLGTDDMLPLPSWLIQ